MDEHREGAQAHENKDLGQLLSNDHARLDRLFQDLLYAFEADARMEVARLWNEFDTGLRAHLQLEEEHLIPKFLELHASEALALLREHETIRKRLLQLGVGVDLHLTRHEQVSEFVRELREHAKREDELLYRWSTQLVHGDVYKSILRRLLTKH